ncbi:Vacuolar protein sorting-associated protein 53 like protein [Aduncisulcus paluster]|uniref:Vacuolar protein sorting-associated protein 53 like protein n=1 Tax=Aduncisulcus paluster TaxID=2918883 RepID=A0ABQ5JY91_9EUKA|nr:Vacuolar protein sorting-associated protein 53 like protein [Aduncisulcus paluster]
MPKTTCDILKVIDSEEFEAIDFVDGLIPDVESLQDIGVITSRFSQIVLKEDMQLKSALQSFADSKPIPLDIPNFHKSMERVSVKVAGMESAAVTAESTSADLCRRMRALDGARSRVTSTLHFLNHLSYLEDRIVGLREEIEHGNYANIPNMLMALQAISKRFVGGKIRKVTVLLDQLALCEDSIVEHARQAIKPIFEKKSESVESAKHLVQCIDSMGAERVVSFLTWISSTALRGYREQFPESQASDSQKDPLSDLRGRFAWISGILKHFSDDFYFFPHSWHVPSLIARDWVLLATAHIIATLSSGVESFSPSTLLNMLRLTVEVSDLLDDEYGAGRATSDIPDHSVDGSSTPKPSRNVKGPHFELPPGFFHNSLIAGLDPILSVFIEEEIIRVRSIAHTALALSDIDVRLEKLNNYLEEGITMAADPSLCRALVLDAVNDTALAARQSLTKTERLTNKMSLLHLFNGIRKEMVRVVKCSLKGMDLDEQKKGQEWVRELEKYKERARKKQIKISSAISSSSSSSSSALGSLVPSAPITHIPFNISGNVYVLQEKDDILIPLPQHIDYSVLFNSTAGASPAYSKPSMTMFVNEVKRQCSSLIIALQSIYEAQRHLDGLMKRVKSVILPSLVEDITVEDTQRAVQTVTNDCVNLMCACVAGAVHTISKHYTKNYSGHLSASQAGTSPAPWVEDVCELIKHAGDLGNNFLPQPLPFMFAGRLMKSVCNSLGHSLICSNKKVDQAAAMQMITDVQHVAICLAKLGKLICDDDTGPQRILRDKIITRTLIILKIIHASDSLVDHFVSLLPEEPESVFIRIAGLVKGKMEVGKLLKELQKKSDPLKSEPIHSVKKTKKKGNIGDGIRGFFGKKK